MFLQYLIISNKFFSCSFNSLNHHQWWKTSSVISSQSQQSLGDCGRLPTPERSPPQGCDWKDDRDSPAHGGQGPRHSGLERPGLGITGRAPGDTLKRKNNVAPGYNCFLVHKLTSALGKSSCLISLRRKVNFVTAGTYAHNSLVLKQMYQYFLATVPLAGAKIVSFHPRLEINFCALSTSMDSRGKNN